MQPPSDPHPHAHPQPESGAHANAQGHDHVPGTASVFLAGSRERLIAAGGVVVVLWCLVWWALD